MKNYKNPNKVLDEVIELVQLKEMYIELKQKYDEMISGKRPVISPYHDDAYLTQEMEYVARKELEERISKAQDFIRNESYLNDTEIDELCEILEGDK